jgi:hypothetical protein
VNVIKVLFLSPLLVLFAGSVLSLFGLPPGWALGVGVLAVVGLWGVGIYKAIEQDRQIEAHRLAAEQAREEAEEKRAIADRMAEEAEAARMETRGALMWFVNSN